MAFRPAEKPPQFADLKGILTQSKETDNPLYQVVQQIIERLTQLKLITPDEIRETISLDKAKPVNKHAPTHMPGGTDELPLPSPSLLLGRGNLSAGPVEYITLGTGVEISGTVLNATGGAVPGPHGSTHAAAGSDKIPISAGSKVLGRDISGAGPMQELSIGSGLSITGGTIDIGAIPEGVIIDQTLLSRNAGNEVITGTWKFTAQRTTFEAVNPELSLVHSSGAANEKNWRIVAVAGSLHIQAVNDAYSAFDTTLQFERVAGQVFNVYVKTLGVTRLLIDATGLARFSYGLAFQGRSDVSVSGDQTAWFPTGLGAVYHICVTPTVAVSIRGILAQIAGYVVVIRNVGGPNITITHADGSASAANRVITPGGAPITLTVYSSVTLIYDPAFACWFVTSKAL